MTSLSQSPRDRILWILANNGDKMERSRLRATTGMRCALLNTILDELVRKVRIRIVTGKELKNLMLLAMAAIMMHFFGEPHNSDQANYH